MVGRPWKSQLFHLNKTLVEVAQNMFGEPVETLEMERFPVPEIMWKLLEVPKGFPFSTEISQPAEAKAAGEVNMQCLRVPVCCVPRHSPSSKVSNSGNFQVNSSNEQWKPKCWYRFQKKHNKRNFNKFQIFKVPPQPLEIIPSLQDPLTERIAVEMRWGHMPVPLAAAWALKILKSRRTHVNTIKTNSKYHQIVQCKPQILPSQQVIQLTFFWSHFKRPQKLRFAKFPGSPHSTAMLVSSWIHLNLKEESIVRPVSIQIGFVVITSGISFSIQLANSRVVSPSMEPPRMINGYLYNHLNFM